MRCVHITIHKTGKHNLARFTIMENAYKFGVFGFVVREDGDMQIEAEGEEENLNNFIAWCHHCQPWSEKEYVTVKEGTFQNFTSFEIGTHSRE